MKKKKKKEAEQKIKKDWKRMDKDEIFLMIFLPPFASGQAVWYLLMTEDLWPLMLRGRLRWEDCGMLWCSGGSFGPNPWANLVLSFWNERKNPETRTHGFLFLWNCFKLFVLKNWSLYYVNIVKLVLFKFILKYPLMKKNIYYVIAVFNIQ